VFPQGRTPAWALTGEGAADFWAPEMHRVARAYWVCFSARLPDRSLAIGLARAATPDGPFRAADAPLVTGGVIDAHLVLDRDGAPLLIWKSDANAVWPRRLVELLHHRPELIARVFPGPADARTAALAAALQPWIGALEAMQQFFALQPLIEAATDDFAGFRSRIGALAGAGDRALDEAVAAVLDATTTHIWAQRLNADGTALVGPRTSILQNDLAWEAHLIEGPWISEVDGRYWLFYAGNDFSTEHYGIGAAVAEHPLGPYRKLAEPLLRSTAEWRGPGHPSVTRGPGGELRMLLHAFRPGQMGYGVFRALLTAELKVDGDHVRVV
jgi:beta-xylosidase